MKILKKDVSVPKFGFVMRLVKHEANDFNDATMRDYAEKVPFGVQQTPIAVWEENGWNKGFRSHDFADLEEATEYFDDALALSDSQMTRKYPKLWTPSRLWKSFRPATRR